MSFYGDKVLPRLQDKAMNRQGTREVRARVCTGLTGKVLEIGFGTGLNVRYYPPEVTTVLAVEPSRVCLRIAEPRIASSNAPVELAGLTGERLDTPFGRSRRRTVHVDPVHDSRSLRRHWGSCGASSSREVPSTSSSTVTPRMPRRPPGNTDLIHSTRGSPEGVI